jgi:dihydroxy-acid dehydratase
LAAVRDGDRIRLSVANKRIELLVGEQELKQRLATHAAPQPPARGYAALYHKCVMQAPSGCDFDFLTGNP